MKSENPYVPIQTPRGMPTKNDRPFYIYATAVVMLFWAGIYVYLQSHYAVSADGHNVYFSPAGYPAHGLYFVSISTILALFALSLVIVNIALWATLKLSRLF